MSESLRNKHEPDLAEAIGKTKGLQPWRRVFHTACGTFVVVALLGFDLPSSTAVAILGLALAFSVVLDALRLFDPKMNILFFRAFSFLASPREARKIASSTWYALSAFLVLMFFPTPYALAGILVLAWADPAASVVGQRWGRTRFLAGTIRGTSAFILAAFCALLFFVPWQIALVTAAITATVEAAPTQLDDNLIVPLTVAGILLLIGG